MTAQPDPPGTIVIVEDDPQLLDQLTWALKGLLEVRGAGDAAKGRALCESDPDLYVLDLRLRPARTI